MIEISTYFFIGLTGGFGHCILMCNPFVMHIACKYADINSGYRILIPHIFYNLGRTLTYSILGAIAGGLGSVIQYAGSFVHIQKSAAIFGGIFLILFALSQLLKMNFLPYIKAPIFLQRFKPSSPLLYGIMLGFLPCGLSMGVIIGAATSASVINGFLMLFSFGLGTTIAMLLMAIFGKIAIGYTKKFMYLANFLILILGFYFIYMGFTF